jgi:hypothetical protein
MEAKSGMKRVLVQLGLVCTAGVLFVGVYYFIHQQRLFLDSNTTTNQIQTTTPLTTTSASVTPVATPTKTTTQLTATTTTVTGKSKTIGFRQCGADMVWACREVSQGMEYDPENPPSEVCGCNPASCPRGQRIITSYDIGTWPDGTGKGTFSCSSEDPPSSETP